MRQLLFLKTNIAKYLIYLVIVEFMDFFYILIDLIDLIDLIWYKMAIKGNYLNVICLKSKYY